ncbi:MAG: EAL domain-containing protein [Rhodocyclaceae bacterium]
MKFRIIPDKNPRNETPQLSSPVRILFVEDSELDAELAMHELTRHDLSFISRRVWRENDLMQELADFDPHLVLSDYSMPNMDGLRSLQIVNEMAQETPFIFVSGTIGEERAIEALTNGATDYVLKTNLSRLGPAVQRALREASDRETRQVLEVSRRQLADILEATPDFVCICNIDMTMTYINAGGLQVLNLPELPLEGLPAERYLPAEARELIRHTAIPHVYQHGTWRGETELLTTRGELIPVSLALIAHPNPDGSIEFLSTIARDVRDRKEYESRIRYLANYDALTGLPNLSLLQDRTAQAILHHQRSETPMALLVVDLDRFTLVNDSFGQAAGDAVLCEIADRIQRLADEEDTVARISADTFVLLLRHAERPDDALLQAKRVTDAINMPVQLTDRELQVSATAGIALFPRDGEDLETLLRNANSALHRAKSQQRGGAQFYDPVMTDEAIQRMEAEASVRLALRRNELMLYYQPQFDVATRRLTGVEALLRWRHPVQGIMAPAALIPIAEDIGLMPAVGDWVLQTACAQAMAWQQQGYAPLRMSVNVAVSQLSDGKFVSRVQQVLDASGLPPALLELEITESGLMANVAESTRILQELKAIGVSIAIDDFGTGYSSLSYLSRLPIDRLKIDQSFISRMMRDKNDREIVLAVLSLARVLKLQVIAEGVETEEQLAMLLTDGCGEAQGYLMSHPLPQEVLSTTHFLPPADGKAR